MNYNKITMKNLPESERPYERLMKYGASSLSDAELIAILLKSGTKEENVIDVAKRVLLSSVGNYSGLGNLMYMDYPDFIKINGIGKVKAITLLASVELGRRIALDKKESSVNFYEPSTVADYFMDEMAPYEVEYFYMLLLDVSNKLIAKINISKGTVSETVASPRECMKEALRYGAVNIILMHNHPSGNPTPSGADILMTERIKRASELLDINLLDHIIIGSKCYVSMKQEGLID